MGLEYRMLGRLEVVRAGESVELGALRQRALLGLLLVHAGTVLSTDRILDDLWGEGADCDRHNSLWVYVSGLRAALEPERAKRSEGTVLLTRAPGYVVTIDPDDTDVGRFERSVAEARVLAEHDLLAASRLLSAALTMWRGGAYEEFAYESWAQGEIARLEELRVEAIENRIDADLRLGMSREIVSELHGLSCQYPLRERIVTALMLALYRSGRSTEALRACSTYCRRLVAEFGVEPSRYVRTLERQILSNDHELLTASEVETRSIPRQPWLTVRGDEPRDETGSGAFGLAHVAHHSIIGRDFAINVIRHAKTRTSDRKIPPRRAGRSPRR